MKGAGNRRLLPLKLTYCWQICDEKRQGETEHTEKEGERESETEVNETLQ